MDCAASQSHFAAMDGRMVVKLARGPPRLSPAIHTRLRSPANSSLVNMAANPPESTILPATTGWSWRCGLALNLPDEIFFARINPLGPREHMIYRKLLVTLAILLPAKTGQRQPKSTRSATHSACIASFCPFTITSGPHHLLTALSLLKPCFCFMLRYSQILNCFCSRALSD
jgi:hypothetical protein